MLITVHKPNENTYLIRPSHPAPMVDHIGKGIYNVSFDPLAGTVTLDKLKTEFKLPKKIRGNAIQANADIIWSTYRRKSADDCVGAILLGMPGTGKSLTAEIICNKALIADMPIFTFADKVPVEVLHMLAKISPAAVFYFDEFSQLGFVHREWRTPNNRVGAVAGDLLTFFSDSSLKGHIFLLTDNVIDSYPPAFINRPGRFLFRIDYDAMPYDEFKSLLVELEVPEGLHETLLYNHVATPYTYDILLRVSEEISRFSTEEEQVRFLQIMNIPRKRIGELVVYFEAAPSTFSSTPYSTAPRLTAIKHSDKEVVVYYQTSDGQSTSTSLHLIDRPACDVSDMPGVRGLAVAWTTDVRPVQNNEEIQVKSANDRFSVINRPQTYGNQY